MTGLEKPAGYPDLIEPTYLPFTARRLADHMPPTEARSPEATERWLDYYRNQASRYREFVSANPDPRGISYDVAKRACQIEKDERCWTAAAMLGLFDSDSRTEHLSQFFTEAVGPNPPEPFRSWFEAIDGDLHLYLEPELPSPSAYIEWLSRTIDDRTDTPYVQHAARRRQSDDVRPRLEGNTHIDAFMVNATNGFGAIIEAKVFSDLSGEVRYDVERNQIARNIDVMLDRQIALPHPLSDREPDKTVFVLLTPRRFFDRPWTRRYGTLMNEYMNEPDAVARDLQHRDSATLGSVPRRLGWTTFESCEAIRPGTCPWLAN